MWHSIQTFEVRDLGSITVLIIFEDESTPQKLLMQGPWTFDKYLIGLYKPLGEESVEDATFDRASFWIQMHNIPLYRMNTATAEAISKTLGTVEQVDASTTGECRGRFLRVQIQLDINQPLCRGCMVNIGEAVPQWVAFQYEKLSIFYYWCSLLNHDEKDCPLWTDDNATVRTEDQQYDAWLRAPTINLQQSQVVTDNNTLKHKPPSGPPRPPRPSSTPTSANTPVTNPTNLITHNTPIQPPTHTSTENLKHMLSHPDMDPPTFSERVTHSVSTNKEILADKNLFDGHFSNIDKALNTYPFPSQSTTPQKETPSLDHPVIISADQTHHVPPTPYLDRALATPTWKLLFPKAVVHHVLMPSSDHSMLAIRLNQPRARQPRPKPLFRFEVMWLQDPRCAEIVQDAWHKGLYKPDGVAIINCYSSCRDRLSVWNKTEFDHVGKQIGRLNQKLQTLEQHLIRNEFEIQED
nr:uncharacterized protein CFP56_70284 [Quercus suber]